MFKWLTKRKKAAAQYPLLVGWREWCGLPDLDVPNIKVKIDTGARTSALHAFNIEPFEENGVKRIRFNVHPRQGSDEYSIACEADLVGERFVTSSNGQKESRYVIQTTCAIGEKSWQIELTLTNRSLMRFRMLLGRTAMAGHAAVAPGESYLQGRKK